MTAKRPASSRHNADQGPQRLWLVEDRSRACIAWCAFRPTTPTRGGTPRSRRLGLSGDRRQHRDRDQRKRMCASTPIAPRAPAASTSTRPTSAVRITHIPTGIVGGLPGRALAAQEPGQRPGKCCAARLYEAELEKREAAANATEAAKTDIGWGHQIRSYVLQPYQLVKDLRTGVESTSPRTCWTAISMTSWKRRCRNGSKAGQASRSPIWIDRPQNMDTGIGR